MSTLGRWLAGILNAHIERDNVPVAEPVPDTPLARFYIGVLDAETVAEHLRDGVEQWRIDERNIDGGWCGSEWPRLWPPRQHEPATIRPCWACGDPVGFHAFHLPCCKVAPWKPASSPWERYP